ncbi:unnamed protein product [Alopecurus aequalis]
MAELAIGLSKSVVVGAITKVQSAIEEDARLRQKVKRDLVFITLELEMMQSFLDDANQEMKNNVMRTWVKHIRQLAYDIEDSVENVVQLDSIYKPVFWGRLLPFFCITPSLPLDEAVQEIEHLKGRVEDVNNCYRRYNLINVDSAAGSFRKELVPGETACDILLAEARHATHGDLRDLTLLIKREEPSLQVISVWGAGGDDGTTSIIRKTYEDPKISGIFTYRFWVKVLHPFSHDDFIRTLMAQFYGNYYAGTHVLTKMQDTKDDVLFREFDHILADNSYLVVLEDLSSIADWDAIRTLFPDSNNRSRVIVSTQRPEIATLCIGPSYRILELIRFSDQHSVFALFKEPGAPEACETSYEVNNPLVGCKSQINELREYLARANLTTKVFSVWGMAGVGKTSFVKHLYFDLMRSKKYAKCIWVDISYPFNLRGFCQSLLSDVDSQKDPIEECRHVLENKRCLVVVDNLQTKKEWDLIQSALVSKSSKSVIIVITIAASIATYCTNDQELMFKVKGIEAAEAFDFFISEVTRKNPLSPLKDNKSKLLKELISKCGGFPGVISAIARTLVNQAGTLHSLNHRLMNHLEIDPEFVSLQGLFHWMHSIILNPPDFLKPCIFYLAIFPRGYHIRRRRILRRWIAEGYSKHGVDKHVEENAENFFSELIQLSIFQPVTQLASNDTRVVFYQVNSLIREYIISRQLEENLVFELSAHSDLTIQSRGRHLIISEIWVRDKIVFESIDFSHLRSLTVFGKWESFFISEGMKLLRVLDLEDIKDLEDVHLEKIVKLLHCLKFLSLRGCKKVFHLPSSLGDLRQLQTLDIRYTSIGSLPSSFLELQKLQYFRAGANFDSASNLTASSSCLPELCRPHCLVGVKVPRRIGKLTSLHTLGVVNVAASGGKVVLKNLEKLTQLRKLGLSGINRKNSNGFLCALSQSHTHLESFSVQLEKDNPGCLDDISLPFENLRSLKLYGLDDKLPQWTDGLSKLVKLDLEMATFKEEAMKSIGGLPQLCILRVKQVKDGDLHFRIQATEEEYVSYQKVKVLQIACGCSSSTLRVFFGTETMKKLELLKVDCLGGSPYYLFSGLENLKGLQQVSLFNTSNPDNTVKRNLGALLSDRSGVRLVCTD